MATRQSDQSGFGQFRTLRERAETLMSAKLADMPTMATRDVQSLVHELNVHQMELELQNEELRLAQVELANSRDRLSDLYDFAPVGYLTIDHRGNIREANLTAAKILRTNRNQLLAQPFSKFMTADSADLLYLHLLRVFEKARKDVCDLPLFDHAESPCSVRLESIQVEEKYPPECRTIISDITELSQAQQAAHRSQRLASLGTLAAGIAHEINNPLWMMALQAEVALATEETPDRDRIVTQCLQEIQQLVERGGRIVRSVLHFSKQDTSDKWPHSLADVLTRARDYTREQAANKRVSVRLKLPEQLPDATFNPTEMEQVFVNLLTNAIQASQAGGHVRVDASINGRLLKVRVEDEGCGISSEDSQRVFDPFYTTRQSDGGTGLGLNVAYGIVQNHNGTIELASQLGRGTTITVILPITEDHRTK